jgi:hypothetical protein
MVQDLEDRLDNGEPWDLPVVHSALKNELREVSKVVEGKTRHFNPYHFAYFLL